MQYKRFPLGALWTNGYLFWDEDGEAFFIDPGGDARILRNPPESLQTALRIHCDPITDFQEVVEGQTLRVGKIEVQVMETPGHTEGGVCYLIAEGDEKVLTSGDTLFAHSVGRTDLDGGDEAKLNASLLRLAKLPDDLRVLPGHGPETNIGKERAHNPFWPVQS